MKTSVCFPFVQGFDLKLLHHYSNYNITKVMRMDIYKERSCWVRVYTGNRRGGRVFFLLLGLFLWSLVCKLKHIPATIQSNFVGEETSHWEDYDKEVPERKQTFCWVSSNTLCPRNYAFPKMPETKINTDGTWQILEVFSFRVCSFLVLCVKSLTVLKGKGGVGMCRGGCLLPVFLQA